jgi:hypothetical membrane protein
MNKKITLAGIIGFVAIVSYLHIVQTGYNPLYQLMSELALGQQGDLMLWAFLSFALSVASVIHLLSHPAIKLLLGLSSLSLAGAGVFKLGDATTLHVALVAFAFVLLVLAMYLTPRLIAAFQSRQATLICWGLGTGTALFVSLGQGILPIGVAQRLATACILLWLAWMAFQCPRKNA